MKSSILSITANYTSSPPLHCLHPTLPIPDQRDVHRCQHFHSKYVEVAGPQLVVGPENIPSDGRCFCERWARLNLSCPQVVQGERGEEHKGLLYIGRYFLVHLTQADALIAVGLPTSK